MAKCWEVDLMPYPIFTYRVVAESEDEAVELAHLLLREDEPGMAETNFGFRAEEVKEKCGDED